MTLPESTDKLNILIVDDQEPLATGMAQRLTHMIENAAVTICVRSADVCQMIQNAKPDIMLLDIRMKEVDGIQCLKNIRETLTAVDLPIIMLTSDDSSETIVTCFNSGANDYVIKGAPISVLISRISSQLSVSQLMRDKIRAKEISAIAALIVSLNHEINNPLSTLVGTVSLIKDDISDKRFMTLSRNPNRISEVIGAISEAGKKFQLEYETYHGQTKMLKLK